LGRYDFLFLCILVYALLLRIERLRPHYFNADLQSNYLVANHIINYGEVSLASAAGIVGTLNSPIYYYILASILLIKDNVLTLNFANIVLQGAAIILVYLLAKRLFSQSTALVATVLLSFSNASISQSMYAWQPFIMQPFLYLSYLLLLLGHLKKNYYFLLLSIFLFMFSGALHSSAFGMLPTFGILMLIVLVKQKATLKRYLGLFLAACSSLLVLYLPPLIYYISSNINFSGHPSGAHKFTTAPSEFLSNFLYSLSLLKNLPITFYWPNEAILMQYSGLRSILFGVIFASCIFYFFSKKIDRSRKIYAGIILFSIFALITSASLLKGHIEEWHLLPIFGLYFIVLAEFINSIFSKRLILKAVKLLVIVLLVQSFYLYSYTPSLNLNIFSKSYYSYATHSSVYSIEKEILKIQEEENIQDINFFQIREFIYPANSSAPTIVNNAYILMALEKEFGTRFTEIVNEYDDGDDNFRSINKDQYVFFVMPG